MSRLPRSTDVPATISEPLEASELPARLLDWYDRHRRDLPWRAAPGVAADPYHVWLSEIMLQQTTVATVGTYFGRFVTRWPSVASLAVASLDDVLHAWQGLGYYARARNLHKCARVVMERHAGRFPQTEVELRKLPGIGDYTAAAIAAIAFGRAATPVDGNIERVIARIFACDETLPDAKPTLRRFASMLTPPDRPGDYAQAAMDLGATICTPRRPKCILCPWRLACRGRMQGIAESLPLRRAKAQKPLRHGVAFWVVRPDGAALLRRRAEKGLLGGMIEVPSTLWREAPWTDAEAKAQAPLSAKWRRLAGTVRHTFTHFHLELTVLTASMRTEALKSALWVKPDQLGEQALPTVMKKVIAHARKGALGP